MEVSLIAHELIELLYIPFWLYSNGHVGNQRKKRKDFTFHSGYIL